MRCAQLPPRLPVRVTKPTLTQALKTSLSRPSSGTCAYVIAHTPSPVPECPLFPNLAPLANRRVAPESNAH